MGMGCVTLHCGTLHILLLLESLTRYARTGDVAPRDQSDLVPYKEALQHNSSKYNSTSVESHFLHNIATL